MEIPITLSVVKNLRSALKSSELLDKDLGYKSQVENLDTAMEKVEDALLRLKSAELSNKAIQDWYKNLSAAIYEADDLIDSLVTVAESMRIKIKCSGKLAKMMHLLWYRRKGRLTVSHARLEVITGILSTSADDLLKFEFPNGPIDRREWAIAHSLGYSEDVIGRDGDKEKMVSMMLDPAMANVTDDGVSVLCIVGMGGLGKTTLARLIFDDQRIQKAFHIKLWVCVGNDSPHHLNAKSVLTKILQSAASSREFDESTPEVELASQIHQLLFGNKYLLILDDVSCENPQDLLQLQHLLKGGSSGSWVLVTTRSQQTAKVLRSDGFFYELQGLSDGDSWSLFERIAYGREESTSDRTEFGKEIIKYCANNPFAIREVGRILHDRDTMWSELAKNGLHAIDSSNNNILQLLKLSYNHLDSPLKSCFAYCALLPREYRINKEMLISLWRAQGFIVPSEESQSMEDAGEEYISILLQRCYLKDVERDEFGEIISFKLHPLMHHLARAVTNEVCAIDCIVNDLRENMLHVSVAKHTDTEESFTKSQLRTLIFLSGDKDGLSVSTLLNNCISLRVLDLNNSGIMELPHQISKLVHLRHLDLSGNEMMKVLPKSFTKLKNLETLILLNCKRLRQLPSDLATLAKLKCLDLKGCDSMTSMPAGIGELTCLHKLTRFVVDFNEPGCGEVLKGLQRLTMIRGNLEIRMKGTENSAYERRKYINRSLMFKQNLNAIELCFLRDGRENGFPEVLMEDMRPHSNLRRLWLKGVRGEELPSWATGKLLATFLPNLVEIKIDKCKRLKHLPFFGKLPNLRSLSLCDLRNVEYMEANIGKRDARAEASEIVEELDKPPFFPSLKELWLVRLYKLKGWLLPLFRDDHDAEDRSSNTSRQHLQVPLLFSSLCRLVIRGCPELGVRTGMEECEKGGSTYQSQNSSDLIANSKLLKVTIDSVKCLNSVLWTRSLPCLTELDIEYDDNVEKLEEVGAVLKMSSSLSSLRILRINSCIKLRCIGNGALQHLTALEELTISNCYNLTLSSEQGAADDPSFLPLPKTLRSLKLHRLQKVSNLPEWMRHLATLQSLHIANCNRLNSLPRWMKHPTSLTNIEISNCSEDLCNVPYRPPVASFPCGGLHPKNEARVSLL